MRLMAILLFVKRNEKFAVQKTVSNTAAIGQWEQKFGLM